MLVAALVLSLAGSSLAGQELRTLDPDEMRVDLFLLTDTLQRLHAGLYRYSTPEQMDEAFGTALAAVEEESRDVLWFQRRICELLSVVRCGHTRSRLADTDREAALAARGLLPFEVLCTGTRTWILRVLAEGTGLSPGQELASIDGMTMAQIRERAFARLSGDGFSESGKERQLGGSFAELFVLLVAESNGSYRVELAGIDSPVLVVGIAPEAYFERRVAPERPLVRLELRAEEDAGILSVSAFGDPAGGEPDFPEQLATSFRTLRERGIGHLILDLRGNGGGVDMYGALLVSYLSSKPFGYFERIEVTPEYRGEVEIREAGGRRLMLSHAGLQVQQPSEPGFTGEIAILIDGGTFSTAADVATVAHHNHLAVFFGEETGGGYDGNTSGDSDVVFLRHSRISVGVPKWMYTTANLGHTHAGRGVPPDHPLRPGIEDLLAGRDVVLEAALQWARRDPRGR